MSTITVPIELELTPRSRSIMEALQKCLDPRFVDQEPAAEAAAPISTTSATPAIGQPWPGIDGIYAGISAGQNGEPDAHLVLLNVAPDERMAWPDAVKWAEAQGEGARLPTRFESALLYAHLRDHFDTTGWYWTSSQLYADCAWGQNFDDGLQYYDVLTYEARVRAVRRLPL